MQSTSVTLAIVLLTIVTSLFVYVGIMVFGNDSNAKAIRGLCFTLAVVFLVIGALVVFFS